MTALQRRVLRKNAWRLVPILTLAYVVNYLDRVALGFAALTMNAKVGLTATQFGYGAGIFFFGYCLFEVPSNLALHRFGARRWIARIMITWGLASAASALVAGPVSFYCLRFLLGVAEAGFFPGVAFYLSAWFPAEYRGRMLAWFLLAIPVSSLIGGPISGLLLQMDGMMGIAGWQWLFIIEGLPAVILGLVVLRVLADKPQDASWLLPEERDALASILDSEKRERVKSALLPALRDIRVLILAGVQFGFTLGAYSVTIWLPQIIKNFDLSKSNLTVSLISAIPYCFASAGMIAWAWVVDRTGKKISNLTWACLLGAAGLAIAAISKSLVPSMIGITVAMVGVTSARAIFWTIPTRFLTGVAAAGGLAFINSIGTMGGFVGPSMMGWLKDRTGSFLIGILGVAAMMVVASALSASLKLVVKRE